jgi:type I restriction enzyme M protein
VSKAWNFAHVLRDEGLSYMAYTEQITFLLFLKMADERERLERAVGKRKPGDKPLVPKGYDWSSLDKAEHDGEELVNHYRHILDHLSKQPGMLGEIFRRARPEVQNPAVLRRLIDELIGKENWFSMQADVKGDIYEGLLAKSAEESPKGAGQYFTPRELIKAITDVMQPTPDDTLCDPACGTGGFLLAGHQYVLDHHVKEMTPPQKEHLKKGFAHGVELVPNMAACAS